MRIGGSAMSTQRFTPEFKKETVKQVVERGYTVPDVAARLGVSAHSLYKSHGGWRNAGPRAAFNKPHWPGRWKIGRLLHF